MEDGYRDSNRQQNTPSNNGASSEYYSYSQAAPLGQDYSSYSGSQSAPPQEQNPPRPPPYDQSNSISVGQVQGSNQGQERAFLDHIPFTAQHAQHEAQKHRHPLAALLNKDGNKISFNLVDAGEDTDQLIPEGQDESSFKPAYTIRYNDKFDGQVFGSYPPDFNPDDQTVVGSWNAHTFRSEKLKFEFPWGKWGFDPQDQNWASDVKLLGGKNEMKWVLTDDSGAGATYSKEKGGTSRVNFILRCVDMSDSEKRLVSKIVVQKYSSATIQIPLQIIANKKQLDELVTVSVAVMDWHRDDILSYFTG